MAENLGAIGDAIYSKNEEIAEASAKVKKLEQEKRALEKRLLQGMQAAGTDMVRGAKATVSISEKTRAQIVDWDALVKFVLRKKALHLFERRIASTVYRELKEQLGDKPIPGLNEFVQTRFNIRRVA